MTDPDSVRFELIGTTLLITLNRPERRNAVDGEMATALGCALRAADDDATICAVVITGAGRDAFCAGGDLSAIRRGESIHSRAYPEWGFAGCRRNFISKPMIAAINGAAIGGGFEVALACDLVIAAENAYFCFPEGRHGFPANPGSAYRLMQQLAPKRALELLLTGRPLTAAGALEIGLINRVTPAGDALDAALELASEIALGSSSAVAATKRAALDPRGQTLAEELRVWDWWTHRPD